jgi:hypothetical protein
MNIQARALIGSVTIKSIHIHGAFIDPAKLNESITNAQTEQKYIIGILLIDDSSMLKLADFLTKKTIAQGIIPNITSHIFSSCK